MKRFAHPAHRLVADPLLAVGLLFVIAAAALSPVAQADDTTPDQRAFELRIYTPEKGKMEALERRFRDQTLRLFAKHGMEVIGFWKPNAVEGEQQTLIYLLAYPSHEARNAAWTAFGKDPEWQAVYAESHEDGPLVKKVESTRLDPTDYSPLH